MAKSAAAARVQPITEEVGTERAAKDILKAWDGWLEREEWLDKMRKQAKENVERAKATFVEAIASDDDAVTKIQEVTHAWHDWQEAIENGKALVKSAKEACDNAKGKLSGAVQEARQLVLAFTN
jgi:N-glycosylase/DNA lyase